MGSDTGSLPQVDFSTIPDPDVRRALRAVVQINQQLNEQVHKQQQEIEALLAMMVEKHLGSVGEFKRHMLKLQGSDARSERLHGQIASTTTTTPSPRHDVRAEVVRQSARPEVDGPRRYTL